MGVCVCIRDYNKFETSDRNHEIVKLYYALLRIMNIMQCSLLFALRIFFSLFFYVTFTPMNEQSEIHKFIEINLIICIDIGQAKG